MSTCIITMGNMSGNYLNGLARLGNSLKGKFDGDFIGWIGERSLGAPPHLLNPYAFKVHAFYKAMNFGYKNVLWLDSSCFAIKNVQPIFNVIEKEGYIMQEAGHYCGSWTNDATLDYFGISREEAMAMPMYGNAGLLGLNFESETALRFFNLWQRSMYDGMFKGSWGDHRHDMSCGSIIANKLGMKYKSGNEWLEYASPGTQPKNETIIIQAAGL